MTKQQHRLILLFIFDKKGQIKKTVLKKCGFIWQSCLEQKNPDFIILHFCIKKNPRLVILTSADDYSVKDISSGNI